MDVYSPNSDIVYFVPQDKRVSSGAKRGSLQVTLLSRSKQRLLFQNSNICKPQQEREILAQLLSPKVEEFREKSVSLQVTRRSFAQIQSFE